ncbi:MAG: uracil-DNA glycosylase [Chloroflexi bacterium]|nr:uracil-DNA glycosylase [Chloroflexota bacterium]
MTNAAYDELFRQASACTACQLSRTRTKVVVGDGPVTATVMFIGEAPGYYEDQSGLPFVGAAGKFLDQLLAMAGLKRSEVYICNVLKCRPPENRDPLPIEIQTCRPWLEKQIAIIRPRVIVTLGRYSLAHFFPKDTVGKLRGKLQRASGVPVYPVYHPAAALHNAGLRSTIEQDFKNLARVLQELAQGPSPQPSAPPPPQPKQLEMF